jgi:hypothetical protein
MKNYFPDFTFYSDNYLKSAKTLHLKNNHFPMVAFLAETLMSELVQKTVVVNVKTTTVKTSLQDLIENQKVLNLKMRDICQDTGNLELNLFNFDLIKITKWFQMGKEVYLLREIGKNMSKLNDSIDEYKEFMNTVISYNVLQDFPPLNRTLVLDDAVTQCERPKLQIPPPPPPPQPLMKNRTLGGSFEQSVRTSPSTQGVYTEKRTPNNFSKDELLEKKSSLRKISAKRSVSGTPLNTPVKQIVTNNDLVYLALKKKFHTENE